MVVNGSMLAAELRRRRVRPRSMVDAVEATGRQIYVLGDLRNTPTDLLILAAMSLTGPARA